MSTMSTTNRASEERNVKASIAEVKQDAAAIRDDLRHLKKDAAQLSSHATEQAIDTVKHTAESATDLARQSARSAKRYHGAMCEQVSAHPTAAVLLALGAGVIAGRILAKR